MSTLKSRNVLLDGRRTSLRLERAVWDALDEICQREGMNLNQVCTHVERQRAERSLAAGIRVFVLHYFREAATEAGHAAAGHGANAGVR
ncbi:Predicted DNA-binding protein, contains Ribbon-helix-helix (RHH) domain [Limimonas halophila]|uniref:Predicted DNA-binding protein, contains Ribbon-helix-helix (RHH) domain n=1 Tax=Limimonas halophila TaxID=1082479 RepID=A0A1G7PZX6_9PROT|nr:ribbon-helix-helix domain-containing protein [Limimonas halophila]SDF90920.1 Predicted DNA-binding protein, contains Ribbon-helix-helix (RHH) domain [Limimonas halophila]